MAPGCARSIRPGGHVKEDLVELMMIQSAQMHQVIMNNMTISALSSFAYSSPQLGSAALSNQVIIQDDEDDAEVYHHYYQPALYLSYPTWMLQPTLVYRDPREPASAPSRMERPAVPPPPPPSASGTVGPADPPAAEFHRA